MQMIEIAEVIFGSYRDLLSPFTFLLRPLQSELYFTNLKILLNLSEVIFT